MQSDIQITNRNDTCFVDIEGVIGVPEEWQFDQPSSRVATYEKFRDSLDRLREIDAPEIVVNIRSTGGDVNDALLIYEALSSLDGHIVTRCYGYTASAATVIAQAASEGCREISAHALYLIHNSICTAEGNAEELATRIDLLRKTDARLAEVYAARSGRTPEEFTLLMAENNGSGRWLSPQEALAAGLVDRIIEPAATEKTPAAQATPAGQWRKLSIVITYSDKGDIKLDIDVNDFMEDDEIPVNDPDNPGEPGLPVAPTLECPGYDLTKPFQLLASMFDAQGNNTRPFAFNLASSNGIGSFAVKITSDNSRLTGMVSGIGGPEFDLCTIGASDPAYTVLAGLGFPLGDDLKGATSKSFDIAGAMKLLYPAYEGTHAFAFEITDAKGLSARASLTLTVDPANEGPSIVGVDFNIDETQTPSADRDTEIDITAQTGIKSLDVTIDCDNLDARELGTMGIPARFDLCNIEGFEDTNGTMHPAEDVREAISALGFPIEDAVKDKPSIRLKIDKMFTGLLTGFPGNNNFILTVTENNGLSTTKTLKYYVPAN